MARILIFAVVATLLLGGVLSADLALSNPELEPRSNASADQQQQFVEATAPIVRAGAPVALFALVVGSMLAAVRAVGG